MNNFDDLFEQQPQPEATEKPEPQRRSRKTVVADPRGKAAQGSLRHPGQGVRRVSEGHGDMKAYLDTQSRFPFHSARNAILIGEQCPNAKRVGGYKEWASQGVEILEEEKRLPIIILEPGKAYRREDGSVGQNFYAKEVFDISQTTARDEAQPQVSYDDRLLLKALISNSPVPIRAVEELPGQGRGAMFDPEQNAILVKRAWTRRTSSAASLWSLPMPSLPAATQSIPAKPKATKPMPSAICSARGTAWKREATTSPGWTACFRGKTPRRKSRQPSPICATRLRRSTGAWQGPWASHARAGRKNRNGKGG